MFVSVLNRVWKYERIATESQWEFDDVGYQIAKEKCDALHGILNSKCLAVAKIHYGKWLGLDFVAMIFI